jgi:hypothetical protein
MLESITKMTRSCRRWLLHDRWSRDNLRSITLLAAIMSASRQAYVCGIDITRRFRRRSTGVTPNGTIDPKTLGLLPTSATPAATARISS